MRIAVLVCLLGFAACSSAPEPAKKPENTASAPALYPDLAALYSGDHGMYRGCGPNNGVCHNSREFPNLATLGSIVTNIGAACNEKRDDPKALDDLCERHGDVLRSDGTPGTEIAFIEPDPSSNRSWHVHLSEPVNPDPALRWTVVRPGPPSDIELAPLTDAGATLALDPNDTSGRAIVVTIPAPADAEEDVIAPCFEHAGVVGDPLAIQVGDPNQNGTFGASLGGSLISPGNPDKSYILKRLTDPSAGPLMPRANCCFWTKASLRALWCWIAGLAADGSNALDPIRYEACPSGPPDTMDYPEPGPSCETSGMCPIQPSLEYVAPTFSNLYERVLAQNCAGAACHVGGNSGGLDMSSKDLAYSNLVDPAHPRVTPGDAAHSLLFVKVSPELCTHDCALMPKGQKPLAPAARSLIERWISAGANDD